MKEQIISFVCQICQEYRGYRECCKENKCSYVENRADTLLKLLQSHSYLQIQAGEDGLVNIEVIGDICNFDIPKSPTEYEQQLKLMGICNKVAKTQKALDDKEKEEAVKKAIKSTSDSLVLLFESWYKDNDKPSDMVWNHIMEKIPDILKQTLEEKK
jgi:hypothetical protein